MRSLSEESACSRGSSITTRISAARKSVAPGSMMLRTDVAAMLKRRIQSEVWAPAAYTPPPQADAVGSVPPSRRRSTSHLAFTPAPTRSALGCRLRCRWGPRNGLHRHAPTARHSDGCGRHGSGLGTPRCLAASTKPAAHHSRRVPGGTALHAPRRASPRTGGGGGGAGRGGRAAGGGWQRCQLSRENH